MSLGDIEEYYIKYYKKDGEGIDPITGGKTDFISLKRGYKRYEKNNPQKLYEVVHFVEKNQFYRTRHLSSRYSKSK